MGLAVDLTGFAVLAAGLFVLFVLRLRGVPESPVAYRALLWLVAWHGGSLLLRVNGFV